MQAKTIAAAMILRLVTGIEVAGERSSLDSGIAPILDLPTTNFQPEGWRPAHPESLASARAGARP